MTENTQPGHNPEPVGNLKSHITGLWDKLISVQARDDEERRLGRLFNTLMVISTGITIYLAVIFLLMEPLGFPGEWWIPWVAAAFPGSFIPLSLFCLVMARQGYIHPMILIYSWANFIGIGLAAFVFDGIYSPAWILFMWTVTIAGTLIAPVYALWMTGGVLVYFIALLVLTRLGIYVPPLSFGHEGRDYVNIACLLVIMGASVGLLTYFNIKSLRETHRKLGESEARYRNVFDHAGDIIFTVTKDTSLVSLNPAFEKVTGWQVNEWLNRSFSPLILPSDLPLAYSSLQKALQGESVGVFELTILKKSGEYFTGEFTVSSLIEDDKAILLGICRDITSRKKMEESILKLNEELGLKIEERTQQLNKAQEEIVRREKLATLGLIAGNIGNELRNPLGVMNNAVYFLKMTLTGLDKNSAEYLDLIQNEITQSERILSDLLNSIHTKQPEPESVEAGTLIKMSLEKIKISPNIKINIDIDPLSACVNADPLQVRESLINIIENSVEAMPEGGNLGIKIRIDEEDKKMVQFRISDTGPGIPPENMPKLFQPLFTTKSRGIGLGLVITKNFIEINGGRINVYSNPGRGTTFVITLPAYDKGGR